MSTFRMRRMAFAFVAAAFVAPSSASAEESIGADDAATMANQLDSEIATMKGEVDQVRDGYSITRQPKVGRVERRLREAEIHYLLGDYLRASIVLLDVVEDDSSKGHARFDDCVFLLAESLRRSKNYSGARTYYEQILSKAQGERLKDVVLGLLQIASDTNRFEDVDRHIAYLRQAGTLSRPDVDYIYAKMSFRSAADDPQKLMKAYETFRGIPAGNAVSAPAAYYAGVALVKMGRYEEALKQFQEALTRAGKGPEQQTLRDMAALSEGRLYQELGQLQKSADAYQAITQNSPYFSDMLYEVAWTHVAAANQAKDPEAARKAYTRALQATELLLATAPGSRLYPQASLLQGNLQIRLGGAESAYDTFHDIVDRYGGARDRIVEMITRSTDPKVFFDQLVSDDLQRINPADVLPKVALAWALEEDDMERAVGMEKDLSDSQKFLEESRELIATLDEALQGEQRFNMFPGLRNARSRALSLENRVIDGSRRLLKLERRIVLPNLAEGEQALINSIHAKAMAIEADIEQLPKTSEEVEATREALKHSYQIAGQHAHRHTYKVSSIRAQVVAVEAWLRDNRAKMSPEETKSAEASLDAARADLITIEKDLDTLQADIRKSTDLVAGDGGRERLQTLNAEFGHAQGEELALLRAQRTRVGTDMQGTLARLDQQRAALTGVKSSLEELQVGLDAAVKDDIAEVKHSVAEEVARVEKFTQEHASLSGETNKLVGPVATRSLGSVGEQFKSFVLKADVGIIDVAWARKQAETEKVNGLIKEASDRGSELETEFADVLKE